MRRGVLLLSGLLALASGVQAAPKPNFATAVQLAEAGRAAEAVSIFRRLSRSGDPVAQVNLAVMQALGQGVPQDDVSAAYWAWRARFAGESRAIDLAEYLVLRLTDKARTRLADRLEQDLNALAASGEVTAFLSLGRVALELRSPAQDPKALEWFSLAAAFEVPNAALLRDAVAMRLEPAARLSAQDKTLQAFEEWCQVLPVDAQLPTCSAD
jgi:TPR repeat protein